MAEWIVKLIPIGNPESKLFVIETQGGEPGFGDFVGWHLDQFTFTSDITTAQAIVLLSHSPSSIASCYCLVAESQRIITPTAILGSSLTVTKYKLAYDKPASPVGAPSNLPSGVTVASSQPNHALQIDAAGTGFALADQLLYDHKHTLSFTQTVLPLATNESTRMLVLYK